MEHLSPKSANLQTGEINTAPVPRRLSGELEKTGVRIFSFYENVTSHYPPDQPPGRPRTTRAFGFFCLTQLIAGDGYWLNAETGEMRELTPGEWMLVTPGYRHSYGAIRREFTEDSIAFDGPAIRTLERAGLLKSGVLHLGSERKLLPIIRDLRIGTLGAQFAAYASMLSLTAELFAERSRPDEGSDGARLERLLEKLQNFRGCQTVEEMAEYCNWSENYFRRRFRARTGMTPKNYLDRLRMNRAIELLCGSRIKVCEVAKMLQFEDPYYFCRRFHAETGMTPTAYRARFGLPKK